MPTAPCPTAGEQLTQRLIDAGKHAFHAPLIEIAAGKELSILENKLNKLSTG
ncbi:uroporphyrinogen-III synthase, partial [Proteus mirabilis]